MKKFILSVILVMILSLSVNAKGNYALLKSAIKQYKAGDYTGSMQNLETITKSDPGNALAYYYLGMCYSQIGNGAKATEAYQKVIALSPNSQLSTNASIGITNINPPPPPSPDSKQENGLPVVEKIKQSKDFLSEQAKTTYQEKNINNIIKNANDNKEVNPSLYKRLENFDPQKTKSDDTNKYLNSTPTQEQVAEAMQTLSKAGMNPYAANMQNMQAMQQINPEMMQLNLLMSSMGGGNNNGGGMNNILPMLMMMQNGQGDNKMSPEAIQAMMSSMMMPGMMDMFNSNNNNNN